MSQDSDNQLQVLLSLPLRDIFTAMDHFFDDVDSMFLIGSLFDKIDHQSFKIKVPQLTRISRWSTELEVSLENIPGGICCRNTARAWPVGTSSFHKY